MPALARRDIEVQFSVCPSVCQLLFVSPSVCPHNYRSFYHNEQDLDLYCLPLFFKFLTLKAPDKNCSRRQHVNVYFYLSKKIRLDFFMCLAEDSLQTSGLIFSEKQCKKFMNVVCYSRDWRFKG